MCRPHAGHAQAPPPLPHSAVAATPVSPRCLQREWLEAQQAQQAQHGGTQDWPPNIFEHFYVVVGGSSCVGGVLTHVVG